MSWKLRVLWIMLLGLFAVGLAACGENAARQDASPQHPTKEATPVKENPPKVSTSSAADKGQAAPSSALSEADRKLIEKQKVCPVTGEALGTMGDPVKVVVKGRTVFLCCDGCKEALLADPDKYLAKLDEKK